MRPMTFFIVSATVLSMIPLFVYGFVALRQSPFRTSCHDDLFQRSAVASTKRQGEDGGDSRGMKENVFDQSVVEALDLEPFMLSLSNYAETKRGRDSLLSLLGHNKDTNLFHQSESRRRHQLDIIGQERNPLPPDTTGVFNSGGGTESPSRLAIASIAQSAEQANREYELVREAYELLKSTKDDSSSVEACNFTLPPIYGIGTIPWEGKAGKVDTDHDEWLQPGFSMELEHILQADQVAKQLLDTRRWADNPEIIERAPELSSIAQNINSTMLHRACIKISDTVKIVKVRTYDDPTGRKSYMFRLNGDKYPALEALRRDHQELAALIDPSRRTDGVMDNRLSSLANQIENMEDEIRTDLTMTVRAYAPWIDAGLDCLARMDVLFLKAAYGLNEDGAIPIIEKNGEINVQNFCHPLLALSQSSVVPIDLKLSNVTRALVISGPNGGGKSLALKSFGLCTAMAKLGIPIKQSLPAARPRVDFIDDILVDVGDQQNILEGTSTLMARLGSCAKIIDKLCVNETDVSSSHSIVLFDELGSGTEPKAGAALAQAAMEKLLENPSCRIVATTHSPELKILPMKDERFQCASVLLEEESFSDFKLPTFQMAYGMFGDSYALGAASRCNPRLSDDVLKRAADLLSGGKEGAGDTLRFLTSSLEQKLQAAEKKLQQAKDMKSDATECRRATIALAVAYEKQLSLIEAKLDAIYQRLSTDKNKDSLDVIGETLSEVSLKKKKIKSQKELLAERGLRMVPETYQFTEGETVVILAPGEWEGETAKVSTNAPVDGDGRIFVVPELHWGTPLARSVVDVPDGTNPLLFQKSEIAIWDYSGSDQIEEERSRGENVFVSTSRFYDVLSGLKVKSNYAPSEDKNANKITSSRQRKALAKKRKGKKKKGQ